METNETTAGAYDYITSISFAFHAVTVNQHCLHIETKLNFHRHFT